MTRREDASCLIVAHNYHPAVGAAASRLELVAEALRREGIRTDVLTSSTDTTMRGPSGERIVGTNRSWIPRSRLARTAVLGLRALFEARRHDVVLSDPPPHVALSALVGSRIARKPFVFYFCDSWAAVAGSRPSLPWRVATHVFNAVEQLVVRGASATMASTPALAERARHGAQVTLVRNGTDLDVYSPQGPAWEGEPLPDNYFLYAGTMGLVHGAEVFVRAAQEMWAEGRDLNLVFVGSGTEADVVKDAAAGSGGRIAFLDPVAPEHVAQLLRGSTGALSSMRPVPGYEDAWPVKTLAAMACGAIPVYVSGGDLAEQLSARGLGFVADYSVEGARRVLEAAAALTPEERHDLSEACRSFAVEHLDQRRAAAVVADHVKGLLDGHDQ